MFFYSLIAAFGLHCLFGKLGFMVFPRLGIFELFSILESTAESLLGRGKRLRIAAVSMIFTLMFVLTFAGSYVLLLFIEKINPWLSVVTEVFFMMQIFSMGDVKRCSMKIYNLLRRRQIHEARICLGECLGVVQEPWKPSAIVLNTQLYIENKTSDSVVAPMIFMMIGGAPLGFAYLALTVMNETVNDIFGEAICKIYQVIDFLPSKLAQVLNQWSKILCGVYSGKKQRKVNAGQILESQIILYMSGFIMLFIVNILKMAVFFIR